MTADANAVPDLDQERVEEFAGELFRTYTAGMLTYMIDVAARTGLFDALAAGPGTSEEIAARGGLVERYVRECLGALATGGIVTYDAASKQYTLPAEHAMCLTGNHSLNLAPVSRMNTLLAQHVAGVAEAFRSGGGISYEAYRPEFAEVMDAANRGVFDELLVDGILALSPQLVEQLQTGVRAVDVGCGTGHSTNLMARAFPNSTFVGYDWAADAIELARKEAADYGLVNVSFEVLDVATLPATPSFGVAFAFDAIHDQVDPVGVLDRIHAALDPGGLFAMFDIKASSNLEDNIGNPFGPWLYGVSTLHCMTVSLAHGGAGLGTAWGQELATQMLLDAGFTDVVANEIPDDPFDLLYVAHKPPP